MRRARRGNGLTQSDLAETVGVSRSTIAGVEAGIDSPGLDTVVAIIQTLGLPLSVLVADYTASPDESEIARLVRIFRRLPKNQRRIQISLMHMLAGVPEPQEDAGSPHEAIAPVAFSQAYQPSDAS